MNDIIHRMNRRWSHDATSHIVRSAHRQDPALNNLIAQIPNIALGFSLVLFLVSASVVIALRLWVGQ